MSGRARLVGLMCAAAIGATYEISAVIDIWPLGPVVAGTVVFWLADRAYPKAGQ